MYVDNLHLDDFIIDASSGATDCTTHGIKNTYLLYVCMMLWIKRIEWGRPVVKFTLGPFQK